MSRNTMLWRRCSWARTVPKAPWVAPMTATGFPAKGWGWAREIQSRAFFSGAGIE